MRKIIAITALLASVAAFPVATPALANSSVDPLCGPDAPEGYKRPGGYCEQIDNNGSLLDSKECDYDYILKLAFTLDTAQSLLVACYEVEAVAPATT